MIIVLVAVSVILALVLLLLWRHEGQSQAGQGGAPASVFLTVPLLTVILTGAGYLLIGQNDQTATWLQHRAEYSDVAREILAGASPEAVAREVPAGALVRVMQAELVRQPTVSGWLMLGSFYDQLGAPEQTRFAAERAIRMAPENIEARLLLARALIAEGDGRLSTAAHEQLSWVTERFPNHDSAWMMQAMAAERAGQLALAEQAWLALLSRHGEGETGALLRRGLENVQIQLDRAERFADLQITIEGDHLPAGGTLYVFVREKGGAGQPLAARPQLVRQFPLTLSIDQEHWLQRYPGEHTQLVVGARYTPARGASVDQASLRAPLVDLPLPLTGPVTVKFPPERAADNAPEQAAGG